MFECDKDVRGHFAGGGQNRPFRQALPIGTFGQNTDLSRGI